MKFLTPQACCLDLALLFKMTNIISLSKARKKKEKAQKEDNAQQNRIKFGRRKGDKKLEKLKIKKADQHLSDHKIND